MPDQITSYLRTYVPKAYGYALGLLVAWLGAHAPWVLELLEFLGVDLGNEVMVAFLVTLVVGATEAAYYWLLRRLQPRLPDWLTRALLGSSASPVYVRSGEVAAVAPAGSTITVDGELAIRPRR